MMVRHRMQYFPEGGGAIGPVAAPPLPARLIEADDGVAGTPVNAESIGMAVGVVAGGGTVTAVSTWGSV